MHDEIPIPPFPGNYAVDRPCLLIVIPLEGEVVICSNLLHDAADADRLRAWIRSRPELAALITAGIAASERRSFTEIVHELADEAEAT